MAGMAALESREAVRSAIKGAECSSANKGAKTPKFTGKTTSKQ
jgi:hypothetical protein